MNLAASIFVRIGMKRSTLALCVAVGLGLTGCGKKKASHDDISSDDDGVHGRETHGGEELASLFSAKGRHVYENLAARSGGDALLSTIELDRLAAALRDTRVMPVDGPISDSNGVVKDARTGDDPLRPDGKLIEIDQSRWETYFSTGFDVYRLVFHEYLWAAGFDDENYVISNRLGQIDVHPNGLGSWTDLDDHGAPLFSSTPDHEVTTAIWAAGHLVVMDDGPMASCVSTLKAFVYDPATHRWTNVVAPGNLGLKPGLRAVALGDQVALWGGSCRDATSGSLALSPGGATFDPITGRFDALPIDANMPSPRAAPVLIAQDKKLIVWGGVDDSGQRTDGSVFDTETKTWKVMTTKSAPLPGDYGAATVLGTGPLAQKAIVWRRDNKSCAPIVSAYDTATNGWDAVTSSAAPAFPCDWSSLVWTGERFAFVFGDRYKGPSGTDINGIVWNPATDEWTPMSAKGAPMATRTQASPVWTTFGLVLFGGLDANGNTMRDGYAYLTADDAWQPITSDRAPLERSGQAAVWTGDSLYIWGGMSIFHQPMSTGAIWQPR